jgi:hypothetical protein
MRLTSTLLLQNLTRGNHIQEKVFNAVRSRNTLPVSDLHVLHIHCM